MDKKQQVGTNIREKPVMKQEDNANTDHRTLY